MTSNQKEEDEEILFFYKTSHKHTPHALYFFFKSQDQLIKYRMIKFDSIEMVPFVHIVVPFSNLSI